MYASADAKERTESLRGSSVREEETKTLKRPLIVALLTDVLRVEESFALLSSRGAETGGERRGMDGPGLTGALSQSGEAKPGDFRFSSRSILET